ncbi:hypothetical protein GPECTOR_146g8 [Gonium pectorale]|uniref:Uncharacterized protein n=1 Tax=Gonium pectorale TaxID=33097 RepID=A0A150FXV0_GONPE|nr:hypothetical protein GPECTOR_146g8 [Gonium pectorale]|eukprot:KXZ42443.1 hypothetical protein GPECTOR_146g8 [Gonium pectorale]
MIEKSCYLEEGLSIRWPQKGRQLLMTFMAGVSVHDILSGSFYDFDCQFATKEVQIRTGNYCNNNTDYSSSFKEDTTGNFDYKIGTLRSKLGKERAEKELVQELENQFAAYYTFHFDHIEAYMQALQAVAQEQQAQKDRSMLRLEQLRPEQMPPGQLRPEQLRPVRPEQLQPVRPEQLRPVRPEQLRPVRPEQLQPVRPEQLRPVRPEQLRPVRPEQLRPVRPEQLRPVRPEQLRPVWPEQLRPVRLEQLRLGATVSTVTAPDKPAAKAIKVVPSFPGFSVVEALSHDKVKRVLQGCAEACKTFPAGDGSDDEAFIPQEYLLRPDSEEAVMYFNIRARVIFKALKFDKSCNAFHTLFSSRFIFLTQFNANEGIRFRGEDLAKHLDGKESKIFAPLKDCAHIWDLGMKEPASLYLMLGVASSWATAIRWMYGYQEKRVVVHPEASKLFEKVEGVTINKPGKTAAYNLHVGFE